MCGPKAQMKYKIGIQEHYLSVSECPKTDFWGSKMAYQVKVLASKSNSVGSIPGTHMWKNRPLQGAL